MEHTQQLSAEQKGVAEILLDLVDKKQTEPIDVLIEFTQKNADNFVLYLPEEGQFSEITHFFAHVKNAVGNKLPQALGQKAELLFLSRKSKFVFRQLAANKKRSANNAPFLKYKRNSEKVFHFCL